MKRSSLTLPILAGLFATFMSLPFLVPHLGWMSLFGIVPLLLMDEYADNYGVKHFWWWYYGAFLLWNAFSTFWVCNATIGGGIFASAANALQMAAIFALYRFSKKYLNNLLSRIFLAAAWIAWERFYFSAEISWPWLTLGNAFARTPQLAQWYEFTGTLGGSLWIWAANLILFYILSFVLHGRFGGLRPIQKISLFIAYATVLICPAILSKYMYDSYIDDATESLDIIVAQPNFDPYQKFQLLPQEQQNAILLDLLERSLSHRKNQNPVLLLAPETFTSDILLNNPEKSMTMEMLRSFLARHPEANLLFGATTREHFISDEPISKTARCYGDTLWVESHNSAIIIDTTSRFDIFHKSKLVVGVEKTPFPAVMTKIDHLLGDHMGRDIGQKEISLLNFLSYDNDGAVVNNVPLGCAICYESVYGEYCTGYVRNGARAITIITNDAWWGDTPGYRQHLSYASLRAIELRRDIARCGNTGISAFINSKGDITSESEWWHSQTLEGSIVLRDGETFFVRYGDIVGRVCTLMFLLTLLAAAIRFFLNK